MDWKTPWYVENCDTENKQSRIKNENTFISHSDNQQSIVIILTIVIVVNCLVLKFS